MAREAGGRAHEMEFERKVLDAACTHARCNRSELEASEVCGCFYCLETFKPEKVEQWLTEGPGTAVCPECQIDSVLGSASGYPVCEPKFLQAMHVRWFS